MGMNYHLPPQSNVITECVLIYTIIIDEFVKRYYMTRLLIYWLMQPSNDKLARISVVSDFRVYFPNTEILEVPCQIV
jgi:hypothetical protein